MKTRHIFLALLPLLAMAGCSNPNAVKLENTTPPPKSPDGAPTAATPDGQAAAAAADAS